jgi:hypothetical protein
MSASDTLSAAAALVTGDRARQHGDVVLLHEQVAAYWSQYVQNASSPLTARDVLVMMSLLKIARTQHGEYNRDDYVDALGYISLAAEVADLENR